TARSRIRRDAWCSPPSTARLPITGTRDHQEARSNDAADRPERAHTMLTEQQTDLLARVRTFVSEVVAPRAADLDRQERPEDCFSWEIVDEADARGLRTLTLAPADGRSGGAA